MVRGGAGTYPWAGTGRGRTTGADGDPGGWGDGLGGKSGDPGVAGHGIGLAGVGTDFSNGGGERAN